MQICLLANPVIEIYCCGDDIGIMDLRTYFRTQSDNDNLSLEGILKRIYSHQIYGYAKPVSFRGFFLATEFNLHLLKHGRKIKGWEWDEACLLSHPDAIKEKFNLTDEEIKELLENSKWAKIGI